MKIVNYLDVTLNLTTGKYYPFRKPDNNPLYINTKSNHAPFIIKQIPASISTRVSSLSCDTTEFDKTSQLYNDALRSNGYDGTIQYEENQQTRTRIRAGNQVSSQEQVLCNQSQNALLQPSMNFEFPP